MNFESEDYHKSASNFRDHKAIKTFFNSLLKDFKKTLENALAYKKESSAYDLLLKVPKLDAEIAGVKFFEKISEYESPIECQHYMFVAVLHYAFIDCLLEGEKFNPESVVKNALSSITGDFDGSISKEDRNDAIIFSVEYHVFSHIAACARAKCGISMDMIYSLGNIFVRNNSCDDTVCELRKKNIRAKKGQIKYVPAKNIMLALTTFVEKLSQSFGDPFEKAAYALCEFTRIHPSVTNTGKIARALMNYCLQEAGYPPLIISENMKDRYDEALNSYTSDDFNLYPMRLLLRENACLFWDQDSLGTFDLTDYLSLFGVGKMNDYYEE